MTVTDPVPVGDAAVRIDVAALPDAHRIWAALRAAGVEGVRECVVGARSVLVHTDPGGCDEAELRRVVQTAEGAGGAPGGTIEIPVRYDGADLAEVAAATGLSVAEVIQRHALSTYTVAFLGFSPGFAYLVGLDPALVLPRRDSPRTAVPAGSVAIAGDHSAVYPQRTPGGWHLLGHTDLAVFDPARERPALFAPGDTVSFVP